MSSVKDTIIDYLREAGAREEAQASTFADQLRTAPPGPYRTFLRRHLDETRRHGRQVAERLTDLGAGAGPVELGIGLVEELVGRAVGVALAPLGLFSSRTEPDELLRQARDAIADEAREVAGYRAIERLASAGGDRITASLADRIAGDEERALERLREMLPALVDRVARARFGDELRSQADEEDDPETEEDDGAQATEASEEPEASDEDEQSEGGGPEPSTAGPTNGGPVVARESDRAGEEEREPVDPRDRDGVPGPEMHVEPPWEGYDDMTAAQVLERLQGADEALIGVVRLYEQANKRRKTILQASSEA